MQETQTFITILKNITHTQTDWAYVLNDTRGKQLTADYPESPDPGNTVLQPGSFIYIPDIN